MMKHNKLFAAFLLVFVIGSDEYGAVTATEIAGCAAATPIETGGTLTGHSALIQFEEKDNHNNTDMTEQQLVQVNECRTRVVPNEDIPMVVNNDLQAWYSFQGTGFGMQLSVCDYDNGAITMSNYDLSISIYQGRLHGNLNASPLCADLECIAIATPAAQTEDCHEIVFSTLANRTYLALFTANNVGASNNATTGTPMPDFQFDFSFIRSTNPNNDLCETAHPLKYTSFDYNFSVALGYKYATMDLGADLACYSQQASEHTLHGIFYYLTTEKDEFLSLSSCNMGVAISVFDAKTLEADPIERCEQLSCVRGFSVGYLEGREDRVDARCDLGRWIGLQWEAKADTTYIVWLRARGDEKDERTRFFLDSISSAWSLGLLTNWIPLVASFIAVLAL